MDVTTITGFAAPELRRENQFGQNSPQTFSHGEACKHEKSGMPSMIGGFEPGSLKSGIDTFQETAKALDTVFGASKPQTGATKLSFHFDLFYSLSQKVQMKMGTRGADRFAEVSASVAETFKSNFSLKIDGVGAFLRGANTSLDISSDVTSAFFDSVKGLSDASPEGLEEFLKESDRYFGELEKQFGPLADALEEVKNQVKESAAEFVRGVQTIRSDATKESSQESAPSLKAYQPALQGNGNGLSLVEAGNLSVPQNDYRNFLQSFKEYANRFRVLLMKDFLKTDTKTQTETKFRSFA